MVLDLTQIACPACTLKSSLLPEVRGGHIAEGLPCSESTELESQGRTPVGTDGGGSLSSWLGGASGGRSLPALVAALFVQRAADCAVLWINCWHRGIKRSGWCWPMPGSGGNLASLLERQCIHQGHLPFQATQHLLKNRSALDPALGLVDTST